MILWVRIGKGSTRHLSLGVFQAVTVRGWLGLGSSEGTPGLMPKKAHSLTGLVGAAGCWPGAQLGLLTQHLHGGPSSAIFLG